MCVNRLQSRPHLKNLEFGCTRFPMLFLLYKEKQKKLELKVKIVTRRGHYRVKFQVNCTFFEIVPYFSLYVNLYIIKCRNEKIQVHRFHIFFVSKRKLETCAQRRLTFHVREKNKYNFV